MTSSDPTERYLELSARIAAVEYIIKQAMWMLADDHVRRMGGSATDAVDALADDAQSSLQLATFPSLSPATSDHVAAMAAEHVGRILKELIDEMNAE